MYLTRRKYLKDKEVYHELRRESGRVWTRIVNWYWRTVRRKGITLSKASLQRWLCRAERLDGLAASSGQAVLEQFLEALKAWCNQDDKRANPPHKRKKFNKVVWKNSTISLTENRMLRLSRGRGWDPLRLQWHHPEPRRVELGYRHNRFELRTVYEKQPNDRTNGNKVAGIDLGMNHLAAVCDGEQIYLFNGKELKSKRNYQNKIKAKLQSKIARKEKGSNRWKKLVRTRNKQVSKIRNQIDDLLHKTSRRLVELLINRGVSTVVLGDLTHLHDRGDWGRKGNQKLHQWCYREIHHQISYKSRLAGMDVNTISEMYTSQDCPQCENRNKTSKRTYNCSECGFEGHRDAVGAYNIRKKYLQETSGETFSECTGVVGAMASPRGIRFDPDARCSPSSACKT